MKHAQAVSPLCIRKPDKTPARLTATIVGLRRGNQRSTSLTSNISLSLSIVSKKGN
jgi:hypothetical protein